MLRSVFTLPNAVQLGYCMWSASLCWTSKGLVCLLPQICSVEKPVY